VTSLHAQGLQPDGSEFVQAGSFPGDQVFPHTAVSVSGGYAVWQDSTIDGKGFGIAARRLNSNLSADITDRFRVNETTPGDQERPQVALFADGGAVITWHGGEKGSQRVYARFLTAAGTFVGGEVPVAGDTAGEQLDTAVTVLQNGNAAITWSVFGEDGSLQGVYLRILTPKGEFVTAPVLVNQAVLFNQRNSKVASLADGRLVVVWVSEQQRFVATEVHPTASVDVYARVFTAAGAPDGNEFRVNTADQWCENPDVARVTTGGFQVVWSERSLIRTQVWDIVSTTFDNSKSRVVAPLVVNTFVAGNQIVPSITTLGSLQLVVWTSIWQDGDREGVFGQLMRDGAKVGSEIRVNQVTASRQIHPTVTGDGKTRFLVSWATYLGNPGFDLHAQRYSFGGTIPTPDAPYVWPLTPSSIQVTWPEMVGYAVGHYELSADGAPAVSVNQSPYTLAGLPPGSSHNFRLRYVLKDGQESPWSAVASASTWGADDNFDGLPDDWQALYWGPDDTAWPAGNVDSDHDGATNAQEFKAGTNPMDATSVLRLSVKHREGAAYLEWNTVPGFIYQVQATQKLPPVWADVGSPRFAHGSSDSIALSRGLKGEMFRVIRIR
jgi:hypothetical protein